MQSSCSLLRLNDYCLESILSFLQLEDQLRFAETCCRIRHVFQRWAKWQYAHCVLVAEVSRRELQLLSMVGENVTKLSIYVDDLTGSLVVNYPSNQMYFFRKFCRLVEQMTNLQRVDIWQYSGKRYVDNILLALRKASNLKRLHIAVPNCGSTALKQFQQLEALTLNVKLSSRDLLKLNSVLKLRSLHLSERVSSSRLQCILQHLPLLQELSFCAGRRQHKTYTCTAAQGGHLAKIFAALADKCSCLESLHVKGIICDLHQAEQLARISSLRILTCSFSNIDFMRLLRHLRLLEELRVTLPQHIDVSDMYLDLIGACPKLRLLSIPQWNINDTFEVEAWEILRDFKQRQPLELFIHGRRDSAIVKNAQDIDKTHLICRQMTAFELLKLLQIQI